MKICIVVPDEAYYETLDLLDNAARYCLHRADVAHKKRLNNESWLEIRKNIKETIDWFLQP